MPRFFFSSVVSLVFSCVSLCWMLLHRPCAYSVAVSQSDSSIRRTDSHGRILTTDDETPDVIDKPQQATLARLVGDVGRKTGSQRHPRHAVQRPPPTRASSLPRPRPCVCADRGRRAAATRPTVGTAAAARPHGRASAPRDAGQPVRRRGGARRRGGMTGGLPPSRHRVPPSSPASWAAPPLLPRGASTGASTRSCGGGDCCGLSDPLHPLPAPLLTRWPDP